MVVEPLSPAAVATNDTLTANASGADDDNDTVGFAYVWLKNNVAISGETGDVRSRCARCGTSLVMYGRGDWRGVEIAHQRFSLRRLLARLSQDWRCRRQRHRPAGDFSRWINDAEGGGYHHTAHAAPAS